MSTRSRARGALVVLGAICACACGEPPYAQPVPSPSASPAFSPPSGWTTTDLGDAGTYAGPFMPPTTPVSVAASGRTAVAAWELRGPNQRTQIRAARFRDGRWGPAEGVGANDAGSQYAPEVALDGAGHATVAWASDVQSRWRPWAARLEGDTWRDGEPLDPLSSVPHYIWHSGFPIEIWPRIGFDASWNGVAVWLQTPPPAPKFGESKPSRLAAARFDADRGWEEPVLFGPEGADFHDVGVEAGGEAFTVWTTGQTVWAAHLPAGTSRWDTPVQLGKASWGIAFAVDPAGGAIVVWDDAGGVNAARFSGRWHSPRTVAIGSLRALAVAAANGRAVALWEDRTAHTLRASWSLVPDEWEEEPTTLGPSVTTTPSLGVTEAGTALVAAVSSSGLMAYRFEGGRWHEPEQVTTTIPSQTPGIAVLGDTSILVTWWASDESGRFHAFVGRRDVSP